MKWMPSVRRPRLPVRESRRELWPRDRLNLVTERRPRPSRLSVCDGGMRSVLGNVFLKGRLLSFSGLSAYCTINNGIMNFNCFPCTLNEW